MGQILHGSATTTHAIRAHIRRSQASNAAPSREPGIDATRKCGSETAREWGAVMKTSPEDAAFAADLVSRLLPEMGA